MLLVNEVVQRRCKRKIERKNTLVNLLSTNDEVSKERYMEIFKKKNIRQKFT